MQQARAGLPGRIAAAQSRQPAGLVGEVARVTDAVAALRERLGMTHLVATRPRVEGLEAGWLEASVEALAEAFHDPNATQEEETRAP